MLDSRLLTNQRCPWESRRSDCAVFPRQRRICIRLLSEASPASINCPDRREQGSCQIVLRYEVFRPNILGDPGNLTSGIKGDQDHPCTKPQVKDLLGSPPAQASEYPSPTHLQLGCGSFRVQSFLDCSRVLSRVRYESSSQDFIDKGSPCDFYHRACLPFDHMPDLTKCNILRPIMTNLATSL